MRDSAHHLPENSLGPELVHHYGPQVHLLACPTAALQLAKLCAPSTQQPNFTRIIKRLYQQLLWHALQASWPRRTMSVATRMAPHSDRGHWTGTVTDGGAKTVVVDIARAGTVPAQQVFEELMDLFDPATISQDHMSMARVTDEAGQVVGAAVGAKKLSEACPGATVIVPDPMGATGSTMGEACALYKQRGAQAPKRIIALHLIVTPEYLGHMRKMHPDVQIWAIRLDRGMSSATILDTVPGLYPDEERGLNERQYIIPGAGGMGELLNNTDA